MAARAPGGDRCPDGISRCHKNETIQHVQFVAETTRSAFRKSISNVRTGCLPASMSLQAPKEVT